MKINYSEYSISFSIKEESLKKMGSWLEKHGVLSIVIVLGIISIFCFIYYYNNGLGLAYNDARSHLDIGRRVVEGLNSGLAQLGSVWLPLTHFLMAFTIWNDFMWHSGLSGAIQSMIAFIGTGALIYLFLKELGAGLFGRFIGVAIFVANLNVLYLQSTAMTELMLLGTMTAGAYYLLLWFKRSELIYLIHAAFWIMLSTLVRYDGWFLFIFATIMIFIHILHTRGYRIAEGVTVLFCTLAGFGVFLWFLWNLLIFKDALYFIFGPYSAYRQQSQLEAAGVLATKGNWLYSIIIYTYALAFNSGMFTTLLGFLGAVVLWLNKEIPMRIRFATAALTAPFIFNVLALYMGHSVLFIQGLSGNTWFNVRYGIMMMPSFAIFIGYLVYRLDKVRFAMVGLIAFVTFFSLVNGDAVVVDDARVGSSQKNVTEVSGWLRENTKDEPGFILISVASHDSIIFSSGLPMKKFIHEGAGAYYESALINPDRWARWIVMRSYSDDDSTWKAMKDNIGFERFELVDHYPFADIYKLKDQYLDDLITEPVISKNNKGTSSDDSNKY